jgi:hypothetical protein
LHHNQTQQCPQSPVIPGFALSQLKNQGENFRLIRNLGYTSVVYEPDGNIPPDFVADSRIAIEVRRLNQNFDTGNGKKGLEEDAIPLWMQIENLVLSIKGPTDKSWFVYFRFSRPVKPWKRIGKNLKAALVSFMNQADQASGRIYTDGTFECDVIRASKPLATYFRMGGNSDRESGGFIVAELLSKILSIAQTTN